MKQTIYKVTGMHCASCEILIEKKLLEIPQVKSINASTAQGQVVINYDGELPDLHKINNLFKKEGYTFANPSELINNKKEENNKKNGFNKTFLAFDIALVLVLSFIILQRSGFTGLLNVGSESSIASFFVFGLIAGFSSCAALVGGVVLSMSKQWSEIYGQERSFFKKIQPNLIFNIGRFLSYVFFGAVLGAIGGQLKISLDFTSFLVIVISFVMIILGLQMLGLKAFRRFQFALPKSITSNIVDEKKFQSKYAPSLMGALTFFLPCGFTITMQGLALLSGSVISGGLMMGVFALGTSPALLLIGLSSAKLFSNIKVAEVFSKVAGFLVIFFALFNLNNQAVVLGYKGLDGVISQNKIIDKDLPKVVNGKQIIKMNASASGYSPSYIKVKAGIPIRWEITDTGTSGCTNAIISRSLFPGQIDLTPGQVSIKEFIIDRSGKYGFSCWMGMVKGTFEAVN